MARSFVSASTQRLRNASFAGISGASALTLVGWSKRATSGSAIAFGGERDGAFIGGFEIVAYSNSIVYFMAHNGAQTYASTTSTNTSTNWQHLAMRYDGGGATDADKLKGYIDGALVVYPGGINGPIPATIGTTGAFVVGQDVPTGYSDGSAAEVALYNVALNDDQIASLAAGYSPPLVLPSALIDYWPVMGRATDEEDRVGGQTLTNTNGATVSDHPRIIYPRRRSTYFVAGVAPSFNAAWASQRSRIIGAGVY